jgi:hypothetical protein
MTGVNPWLQQEGGGGDVAVPTPVVVPRASVLQGPAAPQGRSVGLVAAGLPIRRMTTSAAVWVVGCHGGSGESTIAGLVDSWEPTGHAWPEVVVPSGLTAATPAVLVARTNGGGLRAAQHAAAQWAAGAAGPIDLLGLLLVADMPGRLPRPLRDWCQVVAGGVPRTWTVPWVEQWRLGEPAALADGPRELLDVLTEIGELVPNTYAAWRDGALARQTADQSRQTADQSRHTAARTRQTAERRSG